MKKLLLYIFTSFALGFAGLATVTRNTSRESYNQPSQTPRSATSKRIDSSFSEYECVMFDDQEKAAILADQANDLSSLLGLAEKIWAEHGDDSFPNEMTPVIQKLIKLYPEQALHYYDGLPTNVLMNQLMSSELNVAWCKSDILAYIRYFDKNDKLTIEEFCDSWTHIVRRYTPEKSAQCAESFMKLSHEKQTALIERFSDRDEIVLTLLPVVKDPSMLAKLQQIAKKINETPTSVNVPDLEAKMKQDRIDALMKRLETEKTSVHELKTILDEKENSEIRESIIRNALSPKDDENINAAAWLERISGILAIVDELPTYPPNDYEAKRAEYTILHQKELESWLPTQSPRLQRAWADNIIEEKSPEDAFAWIEQLSTASLRSDMREQRIKSWTESNPQAAARYINEKSTAEEKVDLLPNAVYAWALNDYASARKWLDAQTDSPAKVAALQKIEK
jgi:hypothetical protein